MDPSLVGLKGYDTVSLVQAHRLIILKNRVELAQFQNSAPRYLTLAEGFWKALSSLPLTYDYSAYRRVLEAYGTHYLSEGSLGGEYQALLEFDQKALQKSGKRFRFVDSFEGTKAFAIGLYLSISTCFESAVPVLLV